MRNSIVKASLIRACRQDCPPIKVVTVRLPTDRLIDDVVLTSARESRSTPHGDSR